MTSPSISENSVPVQASRPDRFELFSLNFDRSRDTLLAFRRNSMTDEGYPDVAAIAAKIAVYLLPLFLTIALFEAVVLNGARIVLNCGIALANKIHPIFYPEKPTAPTEMERERIPEPIEKKEEIKIDDLDLNQVEMPGLEGNKPGYTKRAANWVASTRVANLVVSLWNKAANIASFIE